MRSHQDHRGELIRVGPYEIGAAGTFYAVRKDFKRADLLIPLIDPIPRGLMPRKPRKLPMPMEDVGGMPYGWRNFLEEAVVPELDKGTRIIAFCKGGHGRTGAFLASPVALLEPEVVDPVLAIRESYCQSAIESTAQVIGVFALRGEALPPQYDPHQPIVLPDPLQD